MIELKPTVKRDISLFSVLAWNKGYYHYLKQKTGWRYPIILYYDSNIVNFYHKLKDFQHFKKIITQKLINDEKLFNRLNKQFQSDVNRLKFIYQNMRLQDYRKIYDLSGKIMSFYIFVVSDRFVAAKPVAWQSRKMSEEILYQVDWKLEKLLINELNQLKINPKLAHFLTLKDIDRIINSKKINDVKIAKRAKGYIIIDGKIDKETDLSRYCVEHNLINPEDKIDIQNQSIIKGQVAFSGTAKGKIKIIYNQKDLDKIEKGDILITTMTNANYIQAIKKCSAFITDEGGITCHAAIISRELGIPCIIGTRIATKVLKDGDLVEVDANKGIVRKIK